MFVTGRPARQVEDDVLKRLVGAALAGLGTFWVGEGPGLGWPGDDIAILGLSVAFYLVSVLTAARLRRTVTA